jgi:hypothetical protein
VAGTDDDMTSRILGTFTATTKLADFAADAKTPRAKKPEKKEEAEEQREEGKMMGVGAKDSARNFMTIFRSIFLPMRPRTFTSVYSTPSGRCSSEFRFPSCTVYVARTDRRARRREH